VEDVGDATQSALEVRPMSRAMACHRMRQLMGEGLEEHWPLKVLADLHPPLQVPTPPEIRVATRSTDH
jgi:hypothetical protein